ncbi:hypothetical protein SAMN02949497_1757 [Methylomagnum ishizawai]|uniref:Uncharacterized protein n=1 Tax=Methylomagnum ishizawai TaxID=1760988 RepID=A0A1Y6D1K0_9GAMM|nr:hypothetical protein [Methylomagnum ishizawai]SMF94442.1 hypothetical protein SAMN02949497_1757 [Methylomagnum ishizawai]
MLWLDGKKIQGHGLRVSAALPLASEDMSGNSSATPKAETGDKGKSLSVSLQIRYQDATWLSDLIALAEGKDGNQERRMFAVQNRTAQAMGIKQVKFDGNLDVKEADRLRAWEVSFTLAEYRSTPEKVEERNPKAAARKVSSQTATGTVAGGTSGGTGAAASGATANSAEPLSGVEKVLKWLDDRVK